ncbi:spore maturation protein A [Oscillibacter sp. PC13]|uniref:spore maturation protein A n=1 Tax=Oscillibacter sp. PC13 TaxID=1855299 RepID=UPI0008F11E79|nr:spore maturation protein A [Oscillibacter sp. PC13]SFP21985.1 spore maturation protein A [Oscillibacter sp. PC13]
MAMTWVWTGMVLLSLVFGLATGNLDAVANAALEGAGSAIELSISMAGVLCLWTGVMEVMNACGLSDRLAKAFRPLLRHLLPEASRDSETLATVSANVSANLLGLGNAATPLGIRAARRMARGCGGVASDELCLLVVLNTASIQLIPATIASVRAASGSQSPFDILPAVWLSSVLSVAAGIFMAKLLARVGRRQK